MPIIQRIEISNILNIKRVDPWKPSWPYQIFELDGRNSAINIPNGGGKSTLMMSILAMLAGNKALLKELRMTHYAPRSTGLFTHVRIQVKMNNGQSTDLASMGGADLPGDSMVFGLYGNSGENENVNLYSYRGTFEDCPIGYQETIHRTLVRDDEFLKRLSECAGLFPQSKKEGTIKEWKLFVSDFFDMPNITQQLNYQIAKGGEGGGSYFDITEDRGSNFGSMKYSAKIFYKLLAPELLTNVMGNMGEAGETFIEDTIMFKVSQLLVAKRRAEQRRQELERTANTLTKLEGTLEYSKELIEAKTEYSTHTSGFLTEMSAIKTVVIDNPIPGIPKLPPASIHPIAKTLVLQNGQWYIPDRVMAEFTNEPASEVNRRASDRNKIILEMANNTQVIDFTCHLKNLNVKGHASKLYSHENAIALIKVTANFTREWTQEKALGAIKEAFDWVKANSDTNPARKLLTQNASEIHRKIENRKVFEGKLKNYDTESRELRDEQQKIGLAQSEYHKMVKSGLFTMTELASPAAAGVDIANGLKEAKLLLETHQKKVSELKPVYALYGDFINEYGTNVSPIEIAERLKTNKNDAEKNKKEHTQNIKAQRDVHRGLEEKYLMAKASYEAISKKVSDLLELKPHLAAFEEIFGNENTAGLITRVGDELKALEKVRTEKLAEKSSLSKGIEALNLFKAAYPDIHPDKWILERTERREALGKKIDENKVLLGDLKARRSDLDKASVAPGKIAREVMEVAGGDAVALHSAIDKMGLTLPVKEKVLTLFSALLHAPVYNSIEEAAVAARSLAEKGIESPVFAIKELEEFCHSNTILFDEMVANTWLVGVRTRPVDCLLDPKLVGREKSILDEKIINLDQQIKENETTRDEKLDPNADEVKLAQQASICIHDDAEARYQAIDGELTKLEGELPRLENRASEKAKEAIRARIAYESKFNSISEETQNELLETSLTLMNQAMAERDNSTEILEDLEGKQASIDEAWSTAVTAAYKIAPLEQIQTFLDGNGNLELMQNAEKVNERLNTEFNNLDKKSRFEFELAQAFHSGDERPKQIGARLRHIEGEIDNIREKIIPELNEEIEELQKLIPILTTDASSIDYFIHNLISRYKEFQLGLGRNEYTLDKSKVLPHTLSDNGADILELTNLPEQVEALKNLSSDLSLMDSSNSRQKMVAAKRRYDEASNRLAMNIDLILEFPTLDLPSHVKIELIQAKDDPSILQRTFDVTKSNYEKNNAANLTAKAYLDEEFGKIGSWLKDFTRRLDVNLKAMKRAFEPERNSTTNKVMKAGFDIKADLAKIDDVEATLYEIIEMIEKYEEQEQYLQSETKSFRDNRKSQMLTRIRDTFYQKVITEPGIKLCMPSITEKPIEIEKKMLSTGQGVAMTLLWLVKLSAYLTEREILSFTSEQALVRKMRANKSQFTIIDGAFSSLSDAALIKDALDGVADQYGSFQLIVTVHDADYKNNFDYFPTLIQAREIDGKIMYAESKTEITSNTYKNHSHHHGTMGVMSITRMSKAEYERRVN